MPRLITPWDDERLARVRREQTDPIVQYIVVRRRSEAPLAELCASVVRACRAGVRFAAFANDPIWAAYYQSWLAGSFRKVCLRAKDGEWERLLTEFDHDRDGDVLVLPPRPRSEREPLLTKLQVLTSVNGDHALPAFAEPAPGSTVIANADLGMSAGKLLAQVGHGALRSMLETSDAPPASRPVTIVSATSAAWEGIVERYDVWPVQDAGFTEVAPGSETVLVVEQPEEGEHDGT